MQTFEVVFSGGAMRIDAATPADAVDAVKRANGDVRIFSVSAVSKPPSSLAEDSLVGVGHNAFACDGMPYRPSNGGNRGRSVAS